MAVMRDWKCDSCNHVFEERHDLNAPEGPPLCHRCYSNLVSALPVGTKSYKINGDNSASITPKKHAGQAPRT